MHEKSKQSRAANPAQLLYGNGRGLTKFGSSTQFIGVGLSVNGVLVGLGVAGVRVGFKVSGPVPVPKVGADVTGGLPLPFPLPPVGSRDVFFPLLGEEGANGVLPLLGLPEPFPRVLILGRICRSPCASSHAPHSFGHLSFTMECLQNISFFTLLSSIHVHVFGKPSRWKEESFSQ